MPIARVVPARTRRLLRWRLENPTSGRIERGEKGDADADEERHRDGAGRNDGGGRGECGAGGIEECGDALGNQNTTGDAERRGEEADDPRLTEDHEANLANVGTDGTEEGEFTQPLADDDGKGVEDEEGADEK
jgi:hypothetical protein